jgi:hypothetical protein
MNTWYSGWLKENLIRMIAYLLIVAPIVIIALAIFTKPTPTPDTLKDFKDGIQNHLVWSISGKCYFVRPHTDQTVYLISVPDCDRK